MKQLLKRNKQRRAPPYCKSNGVSYKSQIVTIYMTTGQNVSIVIFIIISKGLIEILIQYVLQFHPLCNIARCRQVIAQIFDLLVNSTEVNAFKCTLLTIGQSQPLLKMGSKLACQLEENYVAF